MYTFPVLDYLILLEDYFLPYEYKLILHLGCTNILGIRKTIS